MVPEQLFRQWEALKNDHRRAQIRASLTQPDVWQNATLGRPRLRLLPPIPS